MKWLARLVSFVASYLNWDPLRNRNVTSMLSIGPVLSRIVEIR